MKIGKWVKEVKEKITKSQVTHVTHARESNKREEDFPTSEKNKTTSDVDKITSEVNQTERLARDSSAHSALGTARHKIGRNVLPLLPEHRLIVCSIEKNVVNLQHNP